MECLFLPLYAFSQKLVSQQCFAVCNIFQSLIQKLMFLQLFTHAVKENQKQKKRIKKRRKKHVMCGFCTEFQSNCEICAIFSTILFLLISSKNYVPSHCTAPHPFSKLSSNMEQKIKILNIALFGTMIATFFTEDWDFLPAPVCLSEIAPLYHEEILPTQRQQPEVATMTLPVQLLRYRVITNYYLYQTGKSAEVRGRDRRMKRKR